MITWTLLIHVKPVPKRWYLVYGRHLGHTFVDADYYDNDLFQYMQLDVTHWAEINLPEGEQPKWHPMDTDARDLLARMHMVAIAIEEQGSFKDAEYEDD